MKVALIPLFASILFAQTPKRIEFEVASVRPSLPNQGKGAQTPAGSQTYDAQIRLTYLTFRDIVIRAFNVKQYQVTGPEWIGTDRYDVIATLPEGATQDQLPQMFQALLEDRFGMKISRAEKEYNVYILERGNRPFSLKKVEANDPSRTVGVAPQGARGGLTLNLGGGAVFSLVENGFDGKAMTMEQLASTASQFLTLPMVNRTGIDGAYDFHFQLAPEDASVMMQTAAIKRGVGSPDMLRQMEALKPGTFFDSLEKAGLKGDKAKAMLEVINIEQANKMPTEN